MLLYPSKVVLLSLVSSAGAPRFSNPNLVTLIIVLTVLIYGPYDYCRWSAYACLYPARASVSSTTSSAAAVVRQLPETGGIDAVTLLELGADVL